MAIIASGYMVYVAIKAQETLKGLGIKAALVDAYSFPLNPQPILAAGRKASGKVLTLEDNYIGGLASNVAEIAAEAGNVKVHSLYVRRIPKSGKTPEDLLTYCGLNADNVVTAAKKLIG